VDGGPHDPHPVSWWAELLGSSPRFDAAFMLDELSGALVPRIANPMVRREVALAVAKVHQHLVRPGHAELAEDAGAARQRLRATLARVHTQRAEVVHADVVAHAVCGDYPAAAAGAEPLLGWSPTLELGLTALRLETFDAELTITMLDAGRLPADAVRAGRLMGRYQWWPGWLRTIAVRRALAGTLTREAITALEQCGYAALTPAQARVATDLLGGDPAAVAAAALRLHDAGAHQAAEDLRRGGLTAVALAARLISL